MRSRLALFAVAVVLVAGCAPKRIPVSELSGLKELEQRIGGKTGRVVLMSGTILHAKNIHVYADSVSWTSGWIGEGWTDERASALRADVKAIKIRRMARGALKGLGYGAGCGLALAGPMYVMSSDPYRGGFFLVLPVLGALIGIPFGMGAGEDVYEFIPPPGTERASVGDTDGSRGR